MASPSGDRYEKRKLSSRFCSIACVAKDRTCSSKAFLPADSSTAVQTAPGRKLSPSRTIMPATAASKIFLADSAIYCRRTGGSPLSDGSWTHASSTFSMQVDARAGVLGRAFTVLRVGLIQSQLFSCGKPEGTLESHFESIRN